MQKTIYSIFFLFTYGLAIGQELTIPDSHPRIWWNESTLAAAQARFDDTPFEPRAKGDFEEIENGGWKWNNEVAVENALYYLFTGDGEAAQTAIAWSKYNLTETLETEMDEEGISCDRCRWWLQEIIMVYDWCHIELTDQDKIFFQQGITDVVSRWNREKRWGTPDEPASNYNQGYMRNSFLWGVASMGENERAREFIDHALDERWAKFEHYFEEENQSGIPTEGTSYGHTLLNYMLVMFETSKNAGRDLFNQDFFKRAVMFTIYHTTPGPTEYPSGRGKYMTFPFGDASAFWDDRVIVEEFSPFMFYAAHYFEGSHLSNLIYDWAAQAAVENDDILLNYVTDPKKGNGLRDLPLDYYPPVDGTMGQAFTRTSWQEDASAVHLQLIAPELGGHEHQDGLSFSWWRKGSFLTMEVPGRGFGSGYQIPDYSGLAPVDVQATIAHNTLLFGGEGQANTGAKAARVLRLQSDEDFFYAAVDGTNTYKSHIENDNRYSNEFIDGVIREYLFIRPLEVLVIFDRMKSNEEQGDFRKTAIIHLPGTPEPQVGNSFMTTYQGQNVYMETLLPAQPAIAVIDESVYRDTYSGFHRLQIETAEAAEEYFLHVIQAKNEEESLIEVTFSEKENGFNLVVTHPDRGFGRLQLEKGMESKGGAFAFAQDEIPGHLTVLHDSVQLRELTLTGGFKWLNLDGTGGTVLGNRNVEVSPDIWPNPATSELFIHGLKGAVREVTFIAPDGSFIQRVMQEGGRMAIADLTPGLYLVRIESNTGVVIRRFIKQ